MWILSRVIAFYIGFLSYDKYISATRFLLNQQDPAESLILLNKIGEKELAGSENQTENKA